MALPVHLGWPACPYLPGELPWVVVREARDLRDEARALLVKGVNPRLHRKLKRQAIRLAGENTFITPERCPPPADADLLDGLRSAVRYDKTCFDKIVASLLPLLEKLTFLVRLLVLVLPLPLFIMAAFVGVVDGLVRRDVRRFGAGRESGFLYHRAKAALGPLAMLPWVAYLALPVSLNFQRRAGRC